MQHMCARAHQHTWMKHNNLRYVYSRAHDGGGGGGVCTGVFRSGVVQQQLLAKAPKSLGLASSLGRHGFLTFCLEAYLASWTLPVFLSVSHHHHYYYLQ